MVAGDGRRIATSRRYAYEHRLVASEKIGRWVGSHEKIHHKDGNKQDNRPENLEVCASNAEHFVHHRKLDIGRRLPGEDNPEIACACGCGEVFSRYDATGRPRRYMSGHNPMPSPSLDAVMACLADGPKSRAQIIRDTGMSPRVAANVLSRLKKRGLVSHLSRGLYRREG